MSLFQETQIVYIAYLRCLYLPKPLHTLPTPAGLHPITRALAGWDMNSTPAMLVQSSEFHWECSGFIGRADIGVWPLLPRSDMILELGDWGQMLIFEKSGFLERAQIQRCSPHFFSAY